METGSKKLERLARVALANKTATEVEASLEEVCGFDFEPLREEFAYLLDLCRSTLSRAQGESVTELRLLALQNVSRAAGHLGAAFHSRQRSFLYAAAHLLGAADSQLHAARVESARKARNTGPRGGDTKTAAIRREIGENHPERSSGYIAGRLRLRGIEVDESHVRKVRRQIPGP